MSLILSADFGTSALKISIMDRGLNILDTQKEEYPYILLPGERVEIAPSAIINALTATCNKFDKKLREQVSLFCYDSFSPSLMLMNEKGDALYNIITHMDRRSREQSKLICTQFGKERYQQIAGVYPFTGGVSLTTLLWLMQYEPELTAQTNKIGHLPTFLHKFFTGIWAIDLVNASMMGLYNTITQSGWSEEILSAFSVSKDWLSDIHIPGEPLGFLLPDIAEMLALPSGITVTMGTNDVVAAHAGVGNNRPGQILNTAGSSDMVSILTDKPVLNPKYYVRNAGKTGLWQIYATTAGGFAVDWFCKEFCREMDKSTFYNQYLPECLEQNIETTVSFDPYLAEDRQSLERRTGAWHGLTLSTTRSQMLASLVCSIQKVLSDTIALAAQQIEIDPIIKITGGFTDDAILKLKKKMFGNYDFEVLNERTLLGNAIMALENPG